MSATNVQALVELAGRVERAVVADRTIDACIWELIERPNCHYPDCLVDVMDRIIARVKAGGDDCEIPAYTASLDAAMSLVPEGMTFYVDTGTTEGIFDCHACVWSRTDRRMAGGCGGMATPALALTSAALKARAAIEGEG